MGSRQALAWLGHRVREGRLHLDRWRAPDHDLRVLILPGPYVHGFSSHLRGWELAKALRKLGIRVFCVPNQLEPEQRKRVVRREKPHVIIHQKLRQPDHRPWLYPSALNVLDVDDADFLQPGSSEGYAAIVSRYDAAVAGSQFIREWLEQHCPPVEVIWTGSPLAAHRAASRPSQRAPIVGWATSNVTAYAEEAALVRDVALRAAREATFQLRVHGRGDPQWVRAFFAPLEAAGVEVQHVGFLPYRRFVCGLESLAVGLAPLAIDSGSDPDAARFSAGKSFGKVLGYLAADVPIIASIHADHPRFFRDGVNGYLPTSPEAWSDRIVELIRNPAQRDRIASAARTDFRARLSTEAAARSWADLLHRLVAAHATASAVAEPVPESA